MAAILACGPHAFLSHASAGALTRIRPSGERRIHVPFPLHLPPPAINEADKLDLVDPEALRAKLDRMPRRPGVGALRRLLDRTTLLLTDSELERRSIPIAGRAGLPAPETGIWLHGSKVDFYWPDLGLAVETDGLRYHRSPTQQARDRRRDQALTPAGLTPLRFTHAQIAFDADDVEATPRAVVMSLLRLAA
jgi:hypothetical protein